MLRTDTLPMENRSFCGWGDMERGRVQGQGLGVHVWMH